MHILIPAGGRGVRLRPLTDLCPKPLLPLGDRPILTRIVEGLPAGSPVTVLVTAALERHFLQWQSRIRGGRDVRIYTEPVREGRPGGPVAAISECVAELGIDDDLLILMGDSLLPFTAAEFLTGGAPARARVAAYELEHPSLASQFGVVEITDDDQVLSFEEKPASPRSPWVFTGCLYLPRLLARSLTTSETRSLTQFGHLVAHHLARGEAISVFRTRGEWHDIGTVAGYLRAHRCLLPDERRAALISQGNHLQGSVYVHPSAVVSGSRLTNCVIAADARVIDAELTNCVVHPQVAVFQRAVQDKLITLHSELSVWQGQS